MDEIFEIDDLDEFDEFFSSFQMRQRDSDRGPSVKIEQLAPPEAFPCRDCGRYPRLHTAAFKNRAAYPKNVYVDCGGCSQCDGKWHSTREEAVAAWNRENEGAKPRPEGTYDSYDLIHDIVKDTRIPD